MYGVNYLNYQGGDRTLKYPAQAITRSRAANSKKEVETKANQQTTTTTSECFNACHQKYF